MTAQAWQPRLDVEQRRLNSRRRVSLMAKGVALALLLTGAAGGEEQLGLVPLPQASDYPYFLDHDEFSLGAKVLSKQEVETLFATELNRGYIVVEVAVYPPQGGAVKLSPGQFLLRQDGSRDYARAAKPADAAGALQRKNKRGGGRDVTLYPQVGVGYSTGGPYYGRGGGWNTSVGVGVGVGGNNDAPASTEADRETMETELTDKGVPSGQFDKPAAGYLYFPLTVDDNKQAAFSLDFLADDGVVGAAAVRLELHP